MKNLKLESERLNKEHKVVVDGIVTLFAITCAYLVCSYAVKCRKLVTEMRRAELEQEAE